jgi:hypothetical protein
LQFTEDAKLRLEVNMQALRAQFERDLQVMQRTCLCELTSGCAFSSSHKCQWAERSPTDGAVAVRSRVLCLSTDGAVAVRSRVLCLSTDGAIAVRSRVLCVSTDGAIAVRSRVLCSSTDGAVAVRSRVLCVSTGTDLEQNWCGIKW